jgi:hypothetical protein
LAEIRNVSDNDGLFRLYIHSTGWGPINRKVDQRVWLAILVSPEDQIVWTNDDGKPPEIIGGSDADAVYHGIRQAVDHMPDTAAVLIFSPQDHVRYSFMTTREERRQKRYRASGNKRRPQEAMHRAIDDETERRGITLTARRPELHQEFARLDEIQQQTRERWETLWQAAGDNF